MGDIALSPLDRLDEIDKQIQTLESEAQAIPQAAIDGGRELAADEHKRLDEIVGESRDGTDPKCLMAQKWDERRRWAEIVAGITKREQDRKNTTPIDRTKELGDPQPTTTLRPYAMGASRPVIVPAESRFNTRVLDEVGDAWGRDRREREENAYAAGMWFLAHLWPYHPDAAGKPIVAKAREWCRDHGILNQQDTSTPGKGVELIPKPLESAIIEIREMYGVARRFARIYPMSAKTLDIPKFNTGLQVGLVAELAAQALTEKAWTQVNLVAKKAGGYAQWSTEVGEDAIISLAADLARDFGIAMAYREDYTAFMGDGVVDFANMGITGIVNALHANATLTLGAGNTAVSQITLQDFETLMGLITNTMVNLRWFCHKSTYYAAMHPIKTAAGGNTIGTLTDGDPLTPGSDFRFLGIEGVWTNVLPDSTAAAATKGVVVLGDLGRGVAFGDRRGATVRLSEHIKIIEDAMVLTANCRFDIQTHADGQDAQQRVIAQIQLAAT